MNLPSRVIISQPHVIFGGRIKVLLGITEVLNDLGIKPTWLTWAIPGDNHEIADRYNTRADFEVVTIAKFRGPSLGDVATVRFNRRAALWATQHKADWIIDSSNTPQGFATFPRVMSYIHFPREARAASPLINIHDPSSACSPFETRYWLKRAERLVFRLGRVRPQHWLLANSQFTLDAIAAHYQLNRFVRKPIVIYPFADEVDQAPIPDAEKQPIIASLGRICGAKKQIEQARMSADLNAGELWILGHADTSGPYYKQLEHTLGELSANRAFVFPNLPFGMVQERLRQCRYFLHTTVREPFGITTVEGILNGCLPIVHDSGGQREIVPIPKLRFRHLSEVPEIIRYAEVNPVQRQQWQRQLVQHARDNFTKEVFARQFRAYFLEVAAA